MDRISRQLTKILVILISIPVLLFTAIEASADITYLGEIGRALTKTSGTSLTVTTDQAATVGDTIIIGYVTDPAQNLVVNVTDSAGNSYEQAALAVNWANGRSYIFYAQVANLLPIGGTITITGDQSVAAKAAVVTVFSGLADINVLDQFLGNPKIEDQTTETGTTPTVGPTGTTEQANELLIGVIGTNGPVEDAAGTWGNSFINGPREGTTGGDADYELDGVPGLPYCIGGRHIHRSKKRHYQPPLGGHHRDLQDRKYAASVCI